MHYQPLREVFGLVFSLGVFVVLMCLAANEIQRAPLLRQQCVERAHA